LINNAVKINLSEWSGCVYDGFSWRNRSAVSPRP